MPFLHALPHFSIPYSFVLTQCHSVISCCICSDFTCMWPLHIPVNNHTLQHGYWFVTVNPARSFSPIHWLSRKTWTNRNWDRTDQSVYGRSKIWPCVVGVEEQHPPLHLPQHPPPTTTTTLPSSPTPLSLQQGDLCLLTSVCVCLFVCVCVRVFGSMAVTAPGRRRTSFGSWTPSRLSSGTCTGPRRSLPNTSRAASSSCRATWSRTASSGAFVCLCARRRQKCWENWIFTECFIL